MDINVNIVILSTYQNHDLGKLLEMYSLCPKISVVLSTLSPQLPPPPPPTPTSPPPPHIASPSRSSLELYHQRFQNNSSITVIR